MARIDAAGLARRRDAISHRVQPVVVLSDTVGRASAERPLVVALDVGSSSIRGAVHDRLGRTVRGSVVQARYDWQTAGDGSVRLPHRAFMDLFTSTLDQLDTAVGSLGSDVVAGGISCFIHSIVGLDDGGRPVTPVLSWADTTSSSDAARLRDRLDAGVVHAATGAPIHAGYWPARIARLRREQPTIRRWSGLPELLVERLTGRAVVSRSMASGTGLLQRADGGWAEWLFEELGLDATELPPIVNDDESLGPMTRTAARRWPRLSTFGWFAAWVDGGCGNLGLGATGLRKAALMVGTSGAMRAVVPDGAPAIPSGLFAQRLGAGAVIGGQLSEGGGTLAWASRLLGRSQARLDRAAASLEPDSHGLTVLPFVFGERGLGYHDDARGSLLGLTPGTDAVAIYRAVLESIAFSFAAVDDQLSSVLGARPDVIAAGGALAGSPLLVQVLADCLGRDISAAPAIEASRRGAALLCLWAAGSPDDPGAAPPPPMRSIAHDAGRSARYAAARARRADIYQRLLS